MTGQNQIGGLPPTPVDLVAMPMTYSGGDHTAKTKTFISSPIEHLPQSMGLYLNPDRLKIDGFFYEYQKKTRDNNLLLVVAVNIC